jgi:hypothetical protein
MLIREFSNDSVDVKRIAALAQFLLGRAQDTSAQKTISTSTFINLARDQGISLTVNHLKDMIQRPPLNNIIADVTGDENGSGEVVFRGSDIGAGDETMTVDQARDTVDRMAKRAAKKNI